MRNRPASNPFNPVANAEKCNHRYPAIAFLHQLRCYKGQYLGENEEEYEDG